MTPEEINAQQIKAFEAANAGLCSLDPLVRRRFLSNYGAAWIGEGIAFAGLCIGLGICHAVAMWALVILWAFTLGPSKELRVKIERDMSNVAPDGNAGPRPRHTGRAHRPASAPHQARRGNGVALNAVVGHS